MIRFNYILLRQCIVKNFKQKKMQYLECYKVLRGSMNLEEIKEFLTLKASFVVHVKCADSYRLIQKVGVIHESNPFYDER